MVGDNVSISNDGLQAVADYVWSRTVGAPPLPIAEISRISGLSIRRTRFALENRPELFRCHDMDCRLWVAIEEGPESEVSVVDAKGSLERLAPILDDQLSDLWFSVNFTRKFRKQIVGIELDRQLSTVEDLVLAIMEENFEGARDILVHLELLVKRGTYIDLVRLVRAAAAGSWRDLPTPSGIARLTAAEKKRLERNLDVISMRASGATLQEIGDHYRVSRERIRQILNDFDDVIEAQRGLQDRNRHAGTRRLIMETLVDSPGIRREELEIIVGLPWRKIFDLMPTRWNKFFGQEVREARLKWSEETILEAIKRAGQIENPLSQNTFDLLVKEGVIDCCTTVRIAQIFGLWSTACHLAGVTPRASLVGEYHRNWSHDDCIDWVCQFLLSPSTSRSNDAYAEWAKEQEGDPPSFGTIRGIVGPWIWVTNTALSQLRLPEYATTYRRSLEADLREIQP